MFTRHVSLSLLTFSPPIRTSSRDDTCFLGHVADSFRAICPNKAITSGYGHVRVPLQADRTFVLPESFNDIDTSKVRWILSMNDAATALRRYEGVIRQEMMVSADLDQFFDVPDSEFIFK